METIFFSPETIREFYKKYNNKSKDYEFLVSFVLAKFLSKEWGIPTTIGFKLKNKFAKNIPQRGRTSIIKVMDILRTQIDEDTPIDVVIVPGNVDSIKPREYKGRAFQLKRFRCKNNDNETKELIKYLNGIIKKYAKVKVTLFIIPEDCKIIDFAEVQKHLLTNNYPFQSIMFMVISLGKLFIGELWPNPGMNEYNISELFKVAT